MNQREKLLLGIVVGLGVVAFGFYGMRSIADGFRTRRAEIQQLQSDIDREQLNVNIGLRAAEDLIRLEERSLSGDREEAQRLYKAWIADWADRNQLEDVRFKVDSPRDRSQDGELMYRIHTFTVTGKTDLGQLTKMLYEFETAKQLHRMRSLNISPVGEKDLDVFMTIDALALPTAMDRAEIVTDQELVAEIGDLASAQAPIFDRNLFGPENNAPRLGVRSSYTVELGRTLEMDLEAQDRDEVDRLSYAAKLDELPGARLRGSQVEWRPRELGEYIAEVEVTDDGYPALTHRREVTIRVVEPAPPAPPRDPPPPPKFNYSNYTQLTAIIIKAGEPTAWLWVRPTDERLKVKVGDPFTIGDVEGLITAMTFDELTYESNGKLYRMEMRDFVGRAQLIGDAEQPVSNEQQDEAEEKTAMEDAADESSAPLLPPLEVPPHSDAGPTDRADDRTDEVASAGPETNLSPIEEPPRGAAADELPTANDESSSSPDSP